MAVDGGVGLWNENAGAVYNAREYRRWNDRVNMGWDVRVAGGSATSGTANGGVSRHLGSATTGDLAVTQRAAGANMSVDVAVGGAQVGGTESQIQGEYFVFNDAVSNVAITAADPTNPRIDIVGIQVRDSEYSGANNDARIVVVTGTAAGVPAEPALPANFLTLARVDVAAAAASIVNANITDRRRMVPSLGGVTVCTSSTRPAVNLWEGLYTYERDTDALLFYDGSTWKRTGDQIPHSMSNNLTIAAGTRNSTTWAAIPTVCSVSFTKHRADTTLFFDVSLQGPYTSGAPAPIYAGVNYDGTAGNTVQCAMIVASAANSHQTVAGQGQKTGLAAGTYTCSIYWKGDGVNQINFFGANQEFASLLVTESL